MPPAKKSRGGEQKQQTEGQYSNIFYRLLPRDRAANGMRGQIDVAVVLGCSKGSTEDNLHWPSTFSGHCWFVID